MRTSRKFRLLAVNGIAMRYFLGFPWCILKQLGANHGCLHVLEKVRTAKTYQGVCMFQFPWLWLGLYNFFSVCINGDMWGFLHHAPMFRNPRYWTGAVPQWIAYCWCIPRAFHLTYKINSTCQISKGIGFSLILVCGIWVGALLVEHS